MWSEIGDGFMIGVVAISFYLIITKLLQGFKDWKNGL
jgi:hypothetical protein